MGSRNYKKIAALLIAVVLLASSVGTAYAYLSASSGPVTNTFTPDAAVQPAIVTESDGLHVNVGKLDYAVYVRAAIVVTWQNEAGKIHWKMPEAGEYVGSGDYYLHWNTSDWFQYDGYYYLKTMVTDAQTPALIYSCTQLVKPPDNGYTLRVEIVSQTIQALGTTDGGNEPAVTDAWGISVDGGELQKPTT